MFYHKTGLVLGLSVSFLVGCAGGRRASAPKPPAPPTPTTSSQSFPPGEDPGEPGISAREKLIRQEAARIRWDEAVKKQREAVKKEQSPEMTMAEKKIRKEESNRNKAGKRMGDAYARANISCPGGDENTVQIVNPQAFKYPWGISAIVTVANKMAVPVDIVIPGYGTVLRCLCAHGTVSLTVLSDWGGPVYVNIPLTATGLQDNGGLGTSTFNVSLNRLNPQSDTVKPLYWEINF